MWADGQTYRHDEPNMGRLNSLLGRHTEKPKWMEVADHLVPIYKKKKQIS